MKYFYNPLTKNCKSYTGAIPCGEEVTFHIYESEGGEDDFSATSCYFVYCRDGNEFTQIPMNRTNDGFEITLKFSSIGLYFYRFRLGERMLGCGSMRLGVFSDTPQNWQISVFSRDYKTPDWLKGGVMYQIFPDRFYKSGNYPIAENKVLREDWGGIPEYKPNAFGKVLNRDFFGGNLNGIREKLDYLKSLHVTVLYLNPIFEAYSNHRYDTGDYMKIDSLLGSVEDFDRLIVEAKEKGIRLILDGVFNHTGSDSRYFNKYGNYKEELGAYQSPDSPYYDWYVFRAYPDEYDSWWGIETLPAVNEKSPSYQNFMFGEYGVLKTWLRHGIGGYRLDVADELPDFFLGKLRAAVKNANEDAVIIGEVWEDASNKISYSKRRKYLLGNELDSVMNYPLKEAIINFILTDNNTMLRETIALLIDHYPKQTLDSLMNILGTHDTVRIITVCGEKQCYNKEEMANTFLDSNERAKAIERVKVAALLQFTLPGVPCIYYGDETGMEGYQDPFCRRCFDWNHTDEDLVAFYRKLGEIRTQKDLADVFKYGEYHEIFADRCCIVYERRTDEKSAFVYVNRSSGKYTVNLNDRYKEYLSGEIIKGQLEIKPYSYGIFSKE